MEDQERKEPADATGLPKPPLKQAPMSVEEVLRLLGPVVIEYTERAPSGVMQVARRVLTFGVEMGGEQVSRPLDPAEAAADIIRLTRRFTNNWWRRIGKTRREGLRTALIAWMKGELGDRGLPDLVDTIAPVFGRESAERIAATEVTRLYARGNLLAWRDDPGVVAVEWQTVKDKYVCSTCAGRDGKRYTKRNPRHIPPAHVGCRCSLVPVPMDQESEP